MTSLRIRMAMLSLAVVLLLPACSSQQADLSSPADLEDSGIQHNDEPLPTIVSGGAISTVPPTSTPLVTPTSEVILYELIRLRGYLRDTQSTLLELYQEVPQIPPHERSQLEQQMGELIVETSNYLIVIEQLMDQASPEDREAAKGSLQRLLADLQEIESITDESQPRSNVDTTSTPVPLPETDMSMTDLVRKMESVQQQIPPRLQQLSAQQLQAVVGSMADVIGDLDELTSYTASTFGRLDMDQQEAFADEGEGIYDVVLRMDWTPAEETPSPWFYPTGP
jgi:hypothetical protein